MFIFIFGALKFIGADQVFGEQFFVPFVNIFQLLQRGFGLLDLNQQLFIIQLGECLPFFNIIAFFDKNLFDHAADFCHDIGFFFRFDGGSAREIGRNIAEGHLRYFHRNGSFGILFVFSFGMGIGAAIPLNCSKTQYE